MAGLVTSRNASARQYATPDGELRFVFDRRSGGRVALVRFENDPEVHVLRPQGGAGGDEYYRTESGDVTVRITPHGGITVYTTGHRTGMPVAEERAAEPLTPQQLQVAAYQQRMRMLQQIAAQRLGRPVAFVVPREPQLQDTGVLVDAAERVTQGIVLVRNTPIQRVVIRVGPQPVSVVQGQDLIVQVVPTMGYAGRPSSIAIRNVVQRATQGPEQ